MTDFFFYGTLLHLPLLEVVIGRVPRTEPALLPGHTAFLVRDQTFPMLLPGGQGTHGAVAFDLSDEEVARLVFYEGAYSPVSHEVTLASGGSLFAAVFVQPEGMVAGRPWDGRAWTARWGATVAEAARDLMRHYGAGDVTPHLARYPQLLTRGGARVRASAPQPAGLRFNAAPEDVREQAFRLPYAKYFAVEEYDLSFRRFDGRMSETVTRAVFISGDAAVVLPYDPVRDTVLVIEQFRSGPYARGDTQPWLIEAIAGRVDGGETPEEAALREAREEAGLAIRELLPAARYYPSPAAKAEYLYTYVGLADLPETAAGTAGVPGEGEDIRAHVIPFDRLMELTASGEVDNAPLIILAYWLARERAGLRARALGGVAGS